MPGSQDNPVSINQLQLHCAAAQRATVLDAIDSADWPHTDDRHIIVLRRLEIEAEAWAVGKEAATQVRYLIGKAANPWSSDASQAEAVFFADRAEHIAYLCRELVHPSASRPWFLNNQALAQHAFGQPLSSALASVLSNELLLLPAAMEQLFERDLATAVLEAIGSEQINTLIEQLLHTTGFSVDLTSLQQKPGGGDTGTVVSPADPDISSITVREKQRWITLLNRLTGSLAQSTASLAGVLLLWHRLPHILLQRDLATRAVAKIRRQLLAKRTAQQPGLYQLSQKDHLIADAPSTEQAEDIRKHRETRLEQYPTDALPTERHVPTESPEAEQETSPGQPHFFTGCGGFFYLINLLRQPAFLRVIEQSDNNAWQHLYLASVLFEIQLDAPLRTFIAQQLRLDNAGELDTLQVAETDRRLAGLIQQRIGHQPFWPDDLINKIARVHYDLTHLDVDFHRNSVSLEIRLAGLDVNPGWLPWLGRVVNFHYLDDSRLLGGSL